MKKDEEYEKMVEANKEALIAVKQEENQKEAVRSIIALIVTIPIAFYLFGKLCSWLAGTEVVIGPFTFN